MLDVIILAAMLVAAAVAAGAAFLAVLFLVGLVAKHVTEPMLRDR